ncbi:kinase-like domain-containing protein [Phlyctochytrium arcticum]|nr:kinase-like domain-containing protein [Phlyctochytrium arcticum]
MNGAITNSQAATADSGPDRSTDGDATVLTQQEESAIVRSDLRPTKVEFNNCVAGKMPRQPQELEGPEQQLKRAASEEEQERAASAHAVKRRKVVTPTGHDINDGIQEELEDFYNVFPNLLENYRLISKIGEGTFSSVYKAYDLNYHSYNNEQWASYQSLFGKMIKFENTDVDARGLPTVAIKRIYVTSSPQRIYSEIKILHILSGHPNVVPIITAMRHEDQVLAVLPYFRHLDFRDFYLDMTVTHIRSYMRSLLMALEHVHKHNIIHRDVKPSNFLYHPSIGTGVLVDFGLAQDEVKPKSTDHGAIRSLSNLNRHHQTPGYIHNDRRPSVRANRAGTRGFRAPEVLLKVSNQTRAIDIWSAGVTLLCIFSGHFPFFQSNEDQEALLEIAYIFGKQAMKDVCHHLRRRFETNIPSVGAPIPLNELCQRLHRHGAKNIPPEGYDLLSRLLCLNPDQRITAAEAVQHPFLLSS